MGENSNGKSRQLGNSTGDNGSGHNGDNQRLRLWALILLVGFPAVALILDVLTAWVLTPEWAGVYIGITTTTLVAYGLLKRNGKP